MLAPARHSRLRLFVLGLPLIAAAIAGVPGCEQHAPTVPAVAPTAPRAPGPPRIVSSIPPLRGLIQPLISSAVPYEHSTLVPPGASEHGFEISPEQMAALAKADLVVLVGLGMEPQVEKFLHDHPAPGRRVLILADVVKASLLADQHDHDHDSHADHDHDHHDHAADPHIWLDPVLVRDMISACAEAMKSGATSEESARITAAAADTLAKVDRVDADYRTTLAAAPHHTIVVAHDAYGYLARRYGLEVIPISGLAAGEPQPGDVHRAAEVVRQKGLTTIFVEPQLSPAAARRIADATGATTAVLDPLGDGDWFALMEKNLHALKKALVPGSERAP